MDLQAGKDGLYGFIKLITEVKEEIVQRILVNQSSIKYQESKYILILYLQYQSK